jgi:hypothetical protein
MFTRPLLILRINKLEKKREKCKKNSGNNKKQISKIQKNTQKQNERAKGKTNSKTKEITAKQNKYNQF